MNHLKNCIILIGKEPGQGRLLISVTANGQTKATAIGNMDSVPNCVSRCKPAEGIAHCRITIDANGGMTLTNLKPQNVTFVNGTEIVSKKVSPESRVELGKNRYPINLYTILSAASQIVGTNNPVNPPKPASPTNYPRSIRHLERVWNDYDKALYDIQIRQKKDGIFRSLYMPIIVASTLLGYALNFLGIDKNLTGVLSIFLYIIAASVLFYGIYKFVKDKSIEERKELNDKFQDDYICPHCNHFLGFQAYKILKQNTNCPYCKGGFTE